jgi:nitrogen fixation-related uncharacterized protein
MPSSACYWTVESGGDDDDDDDAMDVLETCIGAD